MADQESYPISILKVLFDEHARPKIDELFDSKYAKHKEVDDLFHDILDLNYESANISMSYYREEVKQSGWVKQKVSLSIRGEIFSDENSYNIKNLY